MSPGKIRDGRKILKRNIISILALILFLVLAFVLLRRLPYKAKDKTEDETSTFIQNSLYVKDLDRDCAWDEDHQAYYDEVTDCYFYLNDEMDEPTWFFWYNGISSDFKNFGWMYYQPAEKCWYIQTGKEKWEKLPDSYDTGHLWHIDES